MQRAPRRIVAGARAVQGGGGGGRQKPLPAPCAAPIPCEVSEPTCAAWRGAIHGNGEAGEQRCRNLDGTAPLGRSRALVFLTHVD